MKWSLQQLKKIQKFPYFYEETLDFNEEAANIDDIVSIDKVLVSGNIYRVDDESYRFVYHIKAPLVLECAITLDPVEYLLEGDYDEIYSTVYSDDTFLIEKNTIDTKSMVWINIMVDKPLNVTKPDAYEILKERGLSLSDDYEVDDDEIISYSDGFSEEDED